MPLAREGRLHILEQHMCNLYNLRLQLKICEILSAQCYASIMVGFTAHSLRIISVPLSHVSACGCIRPACLFF